MVIIFDAVKARNGHSLRVKQTLYYATAMRPGNNRFIISHNTVTHNRNLVLSISKYVALRFGRKFDFKGGILYFNNKCHDILRICFRLMLLTP